MSQRIGIIDLGSNTTRMVIYEYERDHYFRLEDEIREVVRLREGMGRTNVLRAAAIQRAINAMRMFKELGDDLGVSDVIVVATSAVRDAVNRESFLARVKAETGWTLRLLSGEEEGRYGALGAVNATCLRDGFVIDLGGGSAQIVEVREGLPGRAASLPLGPCVLPSFFSLRTRSGPNRRRRWKHSSANNCSRWSGFRPDRAINWWPLAAPFVTWARSIRSKNAILSHPSTATGWRPAMSMRWRISSGAIR